MENSRQTNLHLSLTVSNHPRSMKFSLGLVAFQLVAARYLSPVPHDTLVTRQVYCSYLNSGDACTMASEAPCCINGNQVAECMAYEDSSGQFSDTDGNWSFQSCFLGCYIDDAGVGHCKSSSCDCNDQCCRDVNCQADSQYCLCSGCASKYSRM
jgi:hypothetical protein